MADFTAQHARAVGHGGALHAQAAAVSLISGQVFAARGDAGHPPRISDRLKSEGAEHIHGEAALLIPLVQRITHRPVHPASEHVLNTHPARRRCWRAGRRVRYLSISSGTLSKGHSHAPTPLTTVRSDRTTAAISSATGMGRSCKSMCPAPWN